MQPSILRQWYQEAPGSWLLQLEKEQLSKWLPLIRGTTVLQIGGMPHCFDLLQQEGRHEYYYLANQADKDVDIIADYDELPIRPNSINLALIVHVLEFMEHPTVLLKEVFDALTPNGKMILFCFNPWSLWGIHKLFSGQKDYPWQGKFKSPARLQQWLSAIGYSNIKDKTLGFRRASKTMPLTPRSMFFEALGQITLPMLGAVTVFLVEKRVYGSLKEARYPWQKRRVMSNGMAEPSTRIINRNKSNDE